MTTCVVAGQPKKKNPGYKATKHIERTFLISDYYYFDAKFLFLMAAIVHLWPKTLQVRETNLLLAVHHGFQVLDHSFTEVFNSVFLLNRGTPVRHQFYSAPGGGD